MSPVTEKIAAIFKFFAEISTLSLLAGFMLSTLINSWTFAGWGVSFLSLATTSDILLSGMRYVIDVIRSFTFSGVFSILFYWILYRHPPNRKNKFALICKSLVLGCWFAIISFIFIYEFLPHLPPFWSFTANQVSTRLWYLLVLFSSGSAGAIAAYLAKEAPVDRNESRIFSKMLIPLLLGGLILALFAASRIFLFRTDVGFEPFFVSVSSPDVPCKETSQLMWVGAEAAVIRCGEQYSAITPRDKLVLRPIKTVEAHCQDRWLYLLARCRYEKVPHQSPGTQLPSPAAASPAPTPAA